MACKIFLLNKYTGVARAFCPAITRGLPFSLPSASVLRTVPSPLPNRRCRLGERGRYGASVIDLAAGGAVTQQQHSMSSTDNRSPIHTRSRARILSSSSSAPSTPRRSESAPCRSSRTPAPPGTPGPFTSEQRTVRRQQEFPPASPGTTSNYRAYRRELFGGRPSPVEVSAQVHQAATPSSHRTRGRGRRRSLTPRRSPTPERRLSPSPGHTPERSISPADQRNMASGRNSPALPEPPDLQEQLTQLTATVNNFVAAQAQQLAQAAAPACAPAVAAPADFAWGRLIQPCPTAFPAPTIAQVQVLAASLLTKLPLLTGRDHHEVAYVLTMLSDYENLPEPLANYTYQRANLLGIAVYYGWGDAIAASTSTLPAAVVLPHGFIPGQRRGQFQHRGGQPQQEQRQQHQPQRRGVPGAGREAAQQAQQQAPAIRGRGRGGRRR